jgi:hypothetical protein
MSKRKFNIILDLDETLLSTVDIEDPEDLGVLKDDKETKDKVVGNKNALKYYNFVITPRPHLQSFLDFLFKNFSVSIWTAASKDYACHIAENMIVPKGSNRKLSCFFFDMHRNISESLYNAPKKLDTLWKQFNLGEDFTKRNTIIIDDLPDVKNSQPGNTYKIPPFDVRRKGHEKDRELIKITKLLSDNLAGLIQSSSQAQDYARERITSQTKTSSKRS